MFQKPVSLYPGCLKSRLYGENLPTQVTETLDLIESVAVDFVIVVAVFTAGYFSNAL